MCTRLDEELINQPRRGRGGREARGKMRRASMEISHHVEGAAKR